MAKLKSSGILLYRFASDSVLEVWIAHMGGPFWSHKDAGAWSIPKGEFLEGEVSELAVAVREFSEEIGTPPPALNYVRLGDFPQPSGKIVIAFAGESDFEVEEVVSNTFATEWPRHSGTIREFPEIDRAEWLPIADARPKLVKGQISILDALESTLRVDGRSFTTAR